MKSRILMKKSIDGPYCHWWMRSASTKNPLVCMMNFYGYIEKYFAPNGTTSTQISLSFKI